MKPFYMVLRDGSSETTVRHSTFGEARAEAGRLARLNPGMKFFVLRCLGAQVVNDLQWDVARHDPAPVMDDEIPF